MNMQACHQLTQTNGITELAYQGAKPWHGLGQSIREGASVEEMQAAAGMNWRIERATVQFSTPDMDPILQLPRMQPHSVKDRVVLYRSDNLLPLGVVSERYNEVQPSEALEFFREMTEAGGYVLESAGTMMGGSRLFAAVKTAQGFDLPGGDEVVGRLLFATACDGSMSTTIGQISLRVVCRNTLNAALGGMPARVHVRHSTKFDAAKAKMELRKISTSFDAFARAAETLAKAQASVQSAGDFLHALLPTPSNGANVEDTRGYKTIMRLFDGEGQGAQLASARGTKWGLLNAVTQYVDHEARARSADTRQDSALFGVGATLKSRALQMLTT